MLTVSVAVAELPENETVLPGVNVPLAPVGKPLTLRFTVEGVVPVLLTDTLNVTLPGVPAVSVPVWAPTLIPDRVSGAAAAGSALERNAVASSASTSIMRAPSRTNLRDCNCVCIDSSLWGARRAGSRRQRVDPFQREHAAKAGIVVGHLVERVAVHDHIEFATFVVRGDADR